MLARLGEGPAKSDLVEVDFVDCNTELLGCKRRDFMALGMLHDPTMGHGWPNWDDVDFAYRAHLRGFRILQSNRAIGEHWDYAIADRTAACQRWYRASRSAVWLFNRHQSLEGQIPMLYDKTPLAWGQDSPALVVRKLARRFQSSAPMLSISQTIVSLLERRYPSPVVLGHLYRWLHGAYMAKGYRQGLRDFNRLGIEK
jgi:GT2 family glycosyltransferase